MEPVFGSSQIAAIGHDAETGVLRVQFNSGETYAYRDVPVSVFDAVRGASSIGSAFHRLVKQGGYSYDPE